MAEITNIRQRPGFDAAQYESLLSAAKSEYVSKDLVDKQLTALLDAGKSFSEAVQSIQTALPTLPPPIGKGILWDSGLDGLPSFGANYLAIISDISSEGRRQSAQQRAVQTEIIIDQINEQAEEMRAKAIMQLCIGVISGVASIAQGAISLGMMNIGLGKSAGLDGVAKQNYDMLLNTKVASFNTAIGGSINSFQSLGQAAGGLYDADIKLRDAQIERARAQSEVLKSLEDSLREVISKSLSTQDAIQQNINQTRTKILG